MVRCSGSGWDVRTDGARGNVGCPMGHPPPIAAPPPARPLMARINFPAAYEGRGCGDGGTEVAYFVRATSSGGARGQRGAARQHGGAARQHGGAARQHGGAARQHGGAARQTGGAPTKARRGPDKAEPPMPTALGQRGCARPAGATRRGVTLPFPPLPPAPPRAERRSLVRFPLPPPAPRRVAPPPWRSGCPRQATP